MEDDFTANKPKTRVFDEGYKKGKKKPKLNTFKKQSTRVKSKQQENKIAERLGGSVQRASGAVSGHRGDIKLPEMLLEAKRTDQESFSIKKDWFEKISKEALINHKVPGLVIEFGSVDFLVEKNWIAIPVKFFEELLEIAREKEKEDADEDPES